MDKKEINKVMSFLGKRSGAKRPHSHFVKMGKLNKGRKQDPAWVKKRIAKAMQTRKKRKLQRVSKT